MRLHIDKWGSWNWFLANDNTSSLGKSLVNSTDNIIWSLDFTEEDWFLETWLGGKLTSIEYSSGSWDDLTSTSVDSIGVKGDIMDINSDTSHVFVAHSSLSGGPLPSGLHGVLDFVQELNTLSNIDQHVWSVGIWSERPD